MQISVTQILLIVQGLILQQLFAIHIATRMKSLDDGVALHRQRDNHVVRQQHQISSCQRKRGVILPIRESHQQQNIQVTRILNGSVMLDSYQLHTVDQLAHIQIIQNLVLWVLWRLVGVQLVEQQLHNKGRRVFDILLSIPSQHFSQRTYNRSYKDTPKSSSEGRNSPRCCSPQGGTQKEYCTTRNTDPTGSRDPSTADARCPRLSGRREWHCRPPGEWSRTRAQSSSWQWMDPPPVSTRSCAQSCPINWSSWRWSSQTRSWSGQLPSSFAVASEASQVWEQSIAFVQSSSLKSLTDR